MVAGVSACADCYSICLVVEEMRFMFCSTVNHYHGTVTVANFSFYFLHGDTHGIDSIASSIPTLTILYRLYLLYMDLQICIMITVKVEMW